MELPSKKSIEKFDFFSYIRIYNLITNDDWLTPNSLLRPQGAAPPTVNVYSPFKSLAEPSSWIVFNWSASILKSTVNSEFGAIFTRLKAISFWLGAPFPAEGDAK
jgi:hypothetical protein